MKHLLNLLLVSILSMHAFAGKIPKGTYKVDQIKEACSEASKKQQPVAFIYTNKKLKPS